SVPPLRTYLPTTFHPLLPLQHPPAPPLLPYTTLFRSLTINLLFDTAAMNAPASFRAGIQQAAAILTSMISDRITVNLKIDYSGTGGGAAAGPDGGQWMSYSTVRSNLINNATLGDTTFNALPADRKSVV